MIDQIRSRLLVATLLAALLPATVSLAQPRPSGPMITPNYKDADLGQIVEAVSQVTGKNFIVDPRVRAQVTMLSATPMSPDAFYEAFLAILQVHGFVAVPSGAVIKIVPDANARQLPANDLPDRVSSTSDEIVTQVVQVKNVSAAQLVPILRPLIPQYGHLAAYPSSNILIISDRANNVNRMMRIISRIDQGGDEEIEVIRLEHASATEIVRVVNTLYQAQAQGESGGGVKVVADDRTNSVLVSGEKSSRLKITTLITHLDTPLETGGDAQVRYLRYADAEKIAAKLKEQMTATAGPPGQAGAQNPQDRNATIWADQQNNALVITAPPKTMRSLMQIVDRLDIRRAQVLVEAIIVEVSATKGRDLGVNWLIDGSRDNFLAGGFIQPVGGASIGDLIAGAQDPSSIDPSSVPNGLTLAVGRLKDTGTNFAAMLRALSTDGNTNIISTPSIITMDNEEAEIKVAQEVPFLTGQYSNTTTGGNNNTVNPFQTIQREEVGTILKITPQITDDNTVLLKISQEVSSLAKSTSGAVDLVTNKRTITTKALAEDGEILVLGGLISDEVLDGEQRVPLLGSIPILGQLFKSRNSSKTKTNLMVFIRPKVLRDGEQVAIETNAKYNFIRNEQTKRRGTRVPLMNERRPVLPEISAISPRGATGTVAVPTVETGTAGSTPAASPGTTAAPTLVPAPVPTTPVPDSN